MNINQTKKSFDSSKAMPTSYKTTDFRENNLYLFLLLRCVVVPLCFRKQDLNGQSDALTFCRIFLLLAAVSVLCDSVIQSAPSLCRSALRTVCLLWSLSTRPLCTFLLSK